MTHPLEYSGRGCDILIIGTGYFAEILLMDMALRSDRPLKIVIGGRNVERMHWLANAGKARAAVYGREVDYHYAALDFSSADSLAQAFARLRPALAVQAASIQSPWKVDTTGTPWSDLVARAGFGVTIAFHAQLAQRAAAAFQQASPETKFINTCYPDGVNQLLRVAGLPITTGIGNPGIFAAVIASRLPFAQRGALRVLAHHRHLVEWRKPGAARSGAPVRAWIGDQELEDVDGLTRDVQLPYRDLNVISAGSGVPVLLGLLGDPLVRAHVPGPAGLPGGYPVMVSKAGVEIDLPTGLTLQDAMAWNRQFEVLDGVSVHADGRVAYSEHAQSCLHKYAPDLAQGFHVRDLERAADALAQLRARLGG